MRNLITFSVKHPISIITLILSLCVGGILAGSSMETDFLPYIPPHSLLVSAEFDGIPAQEMRQLVTMPMEDSLASLKGLKTISSVSREGMSLITIELHWGTDSDIAMVNAREIIDNVFPTLPNGCKKPMVQENKSASFSEFQIALIPKDGDLLYARTVAEDEIKPSLQRIEGVSAVTVTGGVKEEIQIKVNRNQADARKITLQNVVDILDYTNFEYPAGTIQNGNSQVLLKTSGLFSELKEITELPLNYSENQLIRLKDIAKVSRTTSEKDTFFLYNDTPCISIILNSRADISPVRMVRGVKKQLSEYEDSYGHSFDFIVLSDSSVKILNSLKSLLISALAGSIITFVVILLVFHSLPIALLISTIIPISSFSALLGLYSFGKTLNTMALSGIAIGIGMVVDASIVTVENILRHNNAKTVIDKNSIITASSEVLNSTIGSTLTTIIVFVPVLILKDLIGALFKDLVISIICSIVTASILAVTYIPAFFSITSLNLSNVNITSPVIEKMRVRYGKILATLLTKRGIAWGGCAIVLILALTTFYYLPFEFLPSVHTDSISAEFLFETGTKMETLEKYGYEIQQKIAAYKPNAKVIVAGGIEKTDKSVLAAPETRYEKITVTVTGISENELRKLFDFQQDRINLVKNVDLMEMALQLEHSGYVFYSDSPESVRTEISSLLADSNSVFYPDIVSTEYVFAPDRLVSSRFGITTMLEASTAYSSLEGILANNYYEKGKQIPVRVVFDDYQNTSVETLMGTGVVLQNGAVLPLRTFGSVELSQKEQVLYRYNRKDAKYTETTLPKSANTVYLLGEIITDIVQESVVLMIGVIILLYLIMAALFESFSVPLLLLIAIPPSFAGSFSALLITHNSLNINSVIALIILFGTSVNNAILLYESKMQNTELSLVDASCNKFRAIFITTITTLAALLPFAVDINHQNVQSSLSIALVGGLLFSTVLVLFVVPVLFQIADNRKKVSKND